MKILILEDDLDKLKRLTNYLLTSHKNSEIRTVCTFTEYIKVLNQDRFDLLILDLVVPRFSDSQDEVSIEDIIEITRGDYNCANFRTPSIALTSYDEKAEESFRILNRHDIAVVTYSPDSEEWCSAVERKIANMPSSRKFDIVVVCALETEANGFAEGGFDVAQAEIINGLQCRVLSLANRSAIIVTAPRMGLVSTSITATHAILAFDPQVICMSGICGGVPNQTSVYDVVISETCHQHDVGKWQDGELKPEIYSVPIDHQLAQRARAAISKKELRERVGRNIVLRRTEFPNGCDEFKYSIKMSPSSSGSAVLGDEDVVANVKAQQRKCAIFDMESYALYEAARLLPSCPFYFSAKTVVDDGSETKSDDFHRIGCILSARVVAEVLNLVKFK